VPVLADNRSLLNVGWCAFASLSVTQLSTDFAPMMLEIRAE
jgi:hypothetical protein